MSKFDATTSPAATRATVVSREQLTELMAAVKDDMHKEITTFKRSLSGEKEGLDEHLKRRKLQRTSASKKTHRNQQYHFSKGTNSQTPSAVDKPFFIEGVSEMQN